MISQNCRSFAVLDWCKTSLWWCSVGSSSHFVLFMVSFSSKIDVTMGKAKIFLKTKVRKSSVVVVFPLSAVHSSYLLLSTV